MTRVEVTNCWDCPFAVKHDWSNEDGDSGTDIEDCALGLPPGKPSYVMRQDLGRVLPSWCRLRAEPRIVALKGKEMET